MDNRTFTLDLYADPAARAAFRTYIGYVEGRSPRAASKLMVWLYDIEDKLTGVIVPPATILESIDPLDPDQILHDGNGIYRAIWPTSQMREVSKFRQHPKIDAIGPTHNEDGRVFVRFRYIPLDLYR